MYNKGDEIEQIPHFLAKEVDFMTKDYPYRHLMAPIQAGSLVLKNHMLATCCLPISSRGRRPSRRSRCWPLWKIWPRPGPPL